MSIDPNITPLRGTVVFERSIKVRDYETAKASFFLQFDLPADGGDEQITRLAKDAFAQAKAVVFEELGIQFSVDEGGYVRELLGKHFGQVTETTAEERQPVQQQQRTQQQRPQQQNNGGGGNGGGGHVCPSCGSSNLWDNRPKKADGSYKPNAADFKCKDCGKSIWLDKK